jgi:hypothetical protein
MKSLLEVTSGDDAITEHADWLELRALFEKDGNVAQEDLVRAVVQAGWATEDRARQLAQDVFVEIEDRIVACNWGRNFAVYPFTLDRRRNLLIRRSKQASVQSRELLYLFLLVTARADMSAMARRLGGRDATAIFEKIGADVLRSFWGLKSSFSDGQLFGTASKGLGNFAAKIDRLCANIGEGNGWKPTALSPGAGDGGLDAVAWRKFADGRAGGLIGFAQCKTGVNWRQHRPRLQPRAFCGDYMLQPLILDPWKIFMVPHRIGRDRWESDCRHGGLLFDRCRIVQYGQAVSASVLQDCRVWLNAALQKEKQLRMKLVKKKRK